MGGKKEETLEIVVFLSPMVLLVSCSKMKWAGHIEKSRLYDGEHEKNMGNQYLKTLISSCW